MTTAFVPVHVGEMELDGADEALDTPVRHDGSRYQRSRLLVRLNGVPLGFVALELEEGHADAEEVRAAVDRELGEAVRAQQDRDERRWRGAALSGGGLDVSASVIVCTKDPSESFRITLRSLLAQEVAPAEVIVVDNASTTDAVERIVGEAGDSRVRRVVEPIPGLSRARNRGLAEARSEFVAFVDDDVRVDAGWLCALLLGFLRAPRVGCVTGMVPAAELETPAQAFFDARLDWSTAFEPRLYDLGSNRADDPFFPYSAGRFGTGANHAVRRELARELGGYDEALGAGVTTQAGEDLDFFLRLIQAGWTLAYEPSSIAWHYHRRDLNDLRRHMYAYGLGLSAYAFKHARRPRVAADLARRLPAAVARLARDTRQAERATVNASGVAAAEFRGLLVGPAHYLRARREVRHISTLGTSAELATFVPAHVGEVEVGRPIADLVAQVRIDGSLYDRARLLVRLHGVPLGFVSVELENGRADGEEVRAAVDRELGEAMSAHLEGDEVRSCRAPGPFCTHEEPVSVVVCTKDPGESLRETLASVLAQDVGPAEVIVVDNASSTDAAQRIVDEVGDSRVRRVVEPVAGLSRARNRALLEAHNEIVAFVDDDVRADAGWLRGLLLGFSRAPRVGCVTGLVPAAELETPAQAFFDARVYWSAGFEPRLYDLGANRPTDRAFPYAAGAFGTGANHAIRRGLAREIGGYDEALGMGTLAENADDLDYFLRVIQAGWTLAYEPSAIAWHYHRRDMEGLRRQMYTYGVGLSAYAFKHARRPRVAAELALCVPPAVVRLFRRARAAEQTATETPGLTGAEMRGMVVGPLRYARSLRSLRRSGQPLIAGG